MVKEAQRWETRALCADSGVDFFAEADLSENASPDDTAIASLETIQARTICANCPVRLECISTALDSKMIWGTWGGADQATIRKALSLDENKSAVPRAKDMVCTYCYSSSLTITVRRRNQTRMVCNDCDLAWWSAKPIIIEKVKTRDLNELAKDVE